MINSFNDVFEEVLKYCYRLTGSDVPNDKRISESGYRMWIQVLKPYKMENNVAYLLAKSDFVKQQTMTAYGDVLNKAFEEVMGFPIKVDIMVSGEDEPMSTVSFLLVKRFAHQQKCLLAFGVHLL